MYVRWATTTSASSVSAAPTCYYPARNVGSYVRRVTLQGQVSTFRTAGPPLSCYKGITPCVSYAGTETVTITPEEGTLILTLNKTSASVGGGIYVTAKGVWATDGVTPVPFTVREWRWEGHGPELGGGHTKVCAAYYPGQCIVQVYQSGYVILEAVVNGKVKTGQVWITVQGGDTLPPLPPDSLPGGGGGDGGDGDGDGNGGGNGGGDGGCTDCCGDSTGTGLHMAACQPPDPPTATVECKGPSGTSDVVRGTNVDCSVVVTPSQNFSVTGWQATPDGGSTNAFPASPTLIGPAVVSTEVGATVSLADGTALNATPARFIVVARDWPKLQLPPRPPILVSHTMDPYNRMTPLPQQGLPFMLGAFGLAKLSFRSLPVTTAERGPNTGYAYFVTAPVFPVPTVYTHPELASGRWYSDQNGGWDSGKKMRRCEAPDIGVLEQKVEVHEGMTQVQESHWGIAYDIFEFSRLTPAWEAMIDATGTPDNIQTVAQQQFLAVWERYLGAQQLFEDVDYPRVFGSLGCALDMDLSSADR